MAVQRSARSDAGLLIAASALAAVLLTGCTGIPVGPASVAPTIASTSAPTGAGSAPASATPDPGQPTTPTAATQYEPGGTAEQNLPYFVDVITRFQASNGWGWGSGEVVDALVAAGFDGKAIEVTGSTTPNGYAAVSIETAVEFPDGCLVATLRAERATALLAPLLPTGACLVGDH